MAKILIVDDDATNRSLLSAILGYHGHTLTEASDGLEGLHCALTHRPDLVIADVVMPNMDGYEFVQKLRTEPGLGTVPVILCTAYFLDRDAVNLGRACGVTHFLAKPCDASDILRAVEASIQTKTPREAIRKPEGTK